MCMALRICSIASGSKGNCVFVGSERTSLIVDMGVPLKRAREALTTLGDAHDVFLTHVHSDHFRYVPDGVKSGMTLHYNRILHNALRGKIEGACDAFYGDICLGDITVSAFPVSHDVPCFGYSFYSEGSKVTLVTDLGVMPKSTLEAISDSDAVFLESNYDEGLLRSNPKYPPYLKARIAGSRGHLSNADSAECVAYLAAHGVKKIMLAHLSEENNTPELALASAENALIKHNLSGKAEIFVALQHEISDMIEV